MRCPAALADAGVAAEHVIGIAIDFTACTILPTLHDGTPLCEVSDLRAEPHAYVKLWKHHAAQAHADRINALAHERGEPWIGRYGGKISAEWAFAKGLQLLEEAPAVYQRAARWIEAADWIVWQLCGRETRNVGTAGYKAIHQDGRYPTRRLPDRAQPGLRRLRRQARPSTVRVRRAGRRAHAGGGRLDRAAGGHSGGSGQCGRPRDRSGRPRHRRRPARAHHGHVDLSRHERRDLAEVPGMCGVVRGGITAGMWGYEAGQSGVGDIFAWYVDHGVPESYRLRAGDRGLHDLLSELAAEQPVGAHGLVALDWWNGNRSLLVDHELSGLLVGMTLATRPPDIYRALLESTAFGTRMIVEAFVDAGLPVTELVVAGGLVSNPFLMQMYADVTRRPLAVIGSDQGPALGSAIHAAVAAGAYPDVLAASEAMGKRDAHVYRPDEDRADAYDLLYAEYRTLHDYFGRGHNDVLHRLRSLRNRALGHEREHEHNHQDSVAVAS